MGTQWLSLWAVQCGCVWWGDGEGAWLGLGRGCHQPGLLQLLRRVCGVRAPARWNPDLAWKGFRPGETERVSGREVG